MLEIDVFSGPANLPMIALSVRQPWAWAIIHAGKDIENRSWQAVNHGLRQRGRIAIHAAKGMTRDEYEDAANFINRGSSSSEVGIGSEPICSQIRLKG